MLTDKVITLLSLIFVVIGGVTWGLVAILGFDPLTPILGGYNSVAAKIIYGLVGISSIIVFYKYLMTPGEDIYRKDK